MNTEPFYAAYPWPLDDICRFWDQVAAQAVACQTHAWMNLWFSPYVAMTHGAKFSDFGRDLEFLPIVNASLYRSEH